MRGALVVLAGACCVGLLLVAAWSGSPPRAAGLLSEGEAAAAAWRKGLGWKEDDKDARNEVLERLRNEIVEEHHRIRHMHRQEHALRAKHAQVQAQVKHLMTASHEATRDVQHLRDRYAARVAEMEKEYHREKARLEGEKDESRQRIRELSDRADNLGVDLSKAIASAKYYDEQRERADQQLVEMDRKAEEAAEVNAESRRELDDTRSRTLDMQVKEAYAVSKRDAAKLLRDENRAALRRSSREHGDLNTARAQLTEEEARAVAETGAAEDAKREVQAAEGEKEALEREVAAEKDKYAEEVHNIQSLQGRADMAEDHTRLLRRRTAHAEEVLSDLKAKEEDVVQESQDAIGRVEKAEAKAAIAKTQGAVIKSMAEKDEKLAEEQVASVKAALAESQKRLEAAETAKQGAQHLRDKAVIDGAYSNGHVRHSEGRLELAKERGHYARLRARLENRESKAKEQQAEGLLHSVGALAALARQAAKVAETARMKAETAAGVKDYGCALNGDFEGDGCGGDDAATDLVAPPVGGSTVEAPPPPSAEVLPRPAQEAAAAPTEG